MACRTNHSQGCGVIPSKLFTAFANRRAAAPVSRSVRLGDDSHFRLEDRITPSAVSGESNDLPALEAALEHARSGLTTARVHLAAIDQQLEESDAQLLETATAAKQFVPSLDIAETVAETRELAAATAGTRTAAEATHEVNAARADLDLVSSSFDPSELDRSAALQSARENFASAKSEVDAARVALMAATQGGASQQVIRALSQSFTAAIERFRAASREEGAARLAVDGDKVDQRRHEHVVAAAYTRLLNAEAKWEVELGWQRTAANLDVLVANWLYEEAHAGFRAEAVAAVLADRPAVFDLLGRHPGFDTALPFLQQWSQLSENIDSIAQPWSLENEANRWALLSGRSTALGSAERDLSSFEQQLNAAAATLDSDAWLYVRELAPRIQMAAVRLTESIAEWHAEKAEFERGGTFAVNVAGAAVQPGERSFSTTVALAELGGTLSIAGWQGMLDVPAQLAESGGVLFANGAAISVDLSRIASLVVGFSLRPTSEKPDDVLTVVFLRGETRLASIQVLSGEVAAYSDADGITGVLLQSTLKPMSAAAQDFLNYFYSAEGQWQAGRSSWEWWTQGGYSSFPMFGGASLAYFASRPGVPDSQKWAILREAADGTDAYDIRLADITVTGSPLLQQIDAPTIDRVGSLRALAAPNWNQNDDTLRRGSSPGFLALGRFGPNVVGFRRDPNLYSAIRLIGLNGGVEATNVAYHTPGGDAPLSREYWQIIDGVVVLTPGAPSQVVVYFSRAGGGDPQGVNIEALQAQSGMLADIMPPQAMTIRTSILEIRGPNVSEGVFPLVTEVVDRGRPVTIGSGNALLNVWNDGRTGGKVRIVTNAGTAQEHAIEFYLGPLQGRSVSIKFTVPADGMLSIDAILPDGSVIREGKLLRTRGDSDEKR